VSRTRTLLVTGGAGFIGANLVHHLAAEGRYAVVNVDKLTYAGNLQSLAGLTGAQGHTFVQADICNGSALAKIFDRYQPDAVLHLAAESHVDRSIDGPAVFVETNVVGTMTLLEVARDYCDARFGGAMDAAARPLADGGFRFVHVSTDEVFGSLGSRGQFRESSRYRPNSPYAASKAAGDHLARAWAQTYGLPVITTNCSNNYGPYQFPEKFVPLAILAALEGRPVPVYGDGKQMRDWLYVTDHVRALVAILEGGESGKVYCIGGGAEKRNLQVACAICDLVDELAPNLKHRRRNLITHVEDRPGHDRRYAMDAARLQRGCSVNSACARAKVFAPACARRFAGISRTAPGGARYATAVTVASASGSSARTEPGRGQALCQATQL